MSKPLPADNAAGTAPQPGGSGDAAGGAREGPASDAPPDLAALRRSVEDAASVAAGLWLSYLFALFYIGIAAGGVLHLDLLLEHAVRLPFLSVELPLLAFFVLAPILFVSTHAYTLVHFILLGAKSRAFNTALAKEHPDGSNASEDLRRQLPSNIFVQFLSGPNDVRRGFFGFILKGIAWCSLAIGPVLLLLLIQAQFLPYHHEGITWLHRLALLADLMVLTLLWSAVLEGRSANAWPSMRRYKWVALASLLPLSVAFLLATFPGERLDAWLDRLQEKPQSLAAQIGRGLGWAHDLLFHGRIDPTLQRRDGFFSDTLVLSNLNVRTAARLSEGEFEAAPKTLILRGRHLESAVFLDTDLRKADLSFAFLQGAQLAGAQLQGATLDSAQLQGAKLDWAKLQGANLNNARLHGAWLEYARLQGATLYKAELQGATLASAQLQGATLEEAQLQGASLELAQLQAAAFPGAQLQGANLAGANFNAAALSGASFWRARLDPATRLEAIYAREPNDWTKGRPPPKAQDAAADASPSTASDALALWKATAARTPPTPIEGASKPNLRALALNRLEGLDPARPFAEEAQVPAWRKRLQTAMVPLESYQSALARELKALVCSGADGADFTLRGLLNNYRIQSAGAQAPMLVKDILDASVCPVANALSASDRARLQTIAKEAAER